MHPIDSGRARTLAAFAVAGQVAFTLGWIVTGALEGHGYSSAVHDISDLGALTAHHPWITFFGQAVAAVATAVFAIALLRPALAIPGKRGALAPWLLLLSLMVLDNLSDIFFRLDCRAADAGCSEAVRTASTSAQIHMVVATFTGVVTLIVPFVFAARFRKHREFRTAFWPAILIGVTQIAALGLYISLDQQWGQGYAQRALALLVAVGIAALAVYTARRMTSSGVAPGR